MQITETGLATVTNVEKSDNSETCKSAGVVQEEVSQLDIQMAETISSPPGANNGPEAIATNDCVSAVLKTESFKLCSDNLEIDIDNHNNKTNGIEIENGGDVRDINGMELGILDQSDTTSVENLSIVTVVEKELEICQETNTNSKIEETINGHGKQTLLQTV